VPVDLPERELDLRFAESAEPGENVVIVRVDERPVDV
jgi:hypothetical protein